MGSNGSILMLSIVHQNSFILRVKCEITLSPLQFYLLELISLYPRFHPRTWRSKMVSKIQNELTLLISIVSELTYLGSHYVFYEIHSLKFGPPSNLILN